MGHDVGNLANLSKGFKDTISTLVNKVCFSIPFIFFDHFSPVSNQIHFE